MVYKTEVPKLGLTIKIGSHRKHGNGAVGSGRQNGTGKKAVVSKDGEDARTVLGNTTKDLMQKLRREFRIPGNVIINEKGESYI
jgi:hypothetical protein